MLSIFKKSNKSRKTKSNPKSVEPLLPEIQYMAPREHIFSPRGKYIKTPKNSFTRRDSFFGRPIQTGRPMSFGRRSFGRSFGGRSFGRPVSVKRGHKYRGKRMSFGKCSCDED